jgi:hypothetical protein
VAALRRSVRDAFTFTDPDFWRLDRAITEMEAAWPFLARRKLFPDFVHTDYRADAIPWPDFVERFAAGEFADATTLRVAVDFSGSQCVEMGWIIPLKRVAPSRKAYRESLIIVDRDGRPRLAWRIEYAPRERRGAPPEMWSLYHDEILWREPTGRIIAIEPGSVVLPPDPDLKVLHIETFERGSLPILFVCTHQVAPTVR